MPVRFSKRFVKQYEKAPADIQSAVKRRIKLFREFPLHPLLHNHLLEGNFLGYRSINITGDWRAIFSESETDTRERIIIFELLGTHSRLYK